MGIVYYNPNDLVIWLEKRSGIGRTLNFAHRESWFIIFMILAIPVRVLRLPIFYEKNKNNNNIYNLSVCTEL